MPEREDTPIAWCKAAGLFSLVPQNGNSLIVRERLRMVAGRGLGHKRAWRMDCTLKMQNFEKFVYIQSIAILQNDKQEYNFLCIVFHFSHLILYRHFTAPTKLQLPTQRRIFVVEGLGPSQIPPKLKYPPEFWARPAAPAFIYAWSKCHLIPKCI